MIRPIGLGIGDGEGFGVNVGVETAATVVLGPDIGGVLGGGSGRGGGGVDDAEELVKVLLVTSTVFPW